MTLSIPVISDKLQVKGSHPSNNIISHLDNFRLLSPNLTLQNQLETIFYCFMIHVITFVVELFKLIWISISLIHQKVINYNWKIMTITMFIKY